MTVLTKARATETPVPETMRSSYVKAAMHFWVSGSELYGMFFSSKKPKERITY
jgi:hypothetical protein